MAGPLLDRYETFIGWRYLFRRRRSPAVMTVTAAFAVASLLLPALFLYGPVPAGSALSGGLAAATVVSLLGFATALFLNVFSVFTSISMAGVMFGVAALTVVLSVTSGFQEQFQNKVLGLNAHVLVMKYGIDFPEYRDVIRKVEKVPHVVAAAPFVFNEMMLAHGSSISGVIVKGVVPGQSDRVLDLAKQLSPGVTPQALSQRGPGGEPQIFLGSELSKKLKVKVGEVVRLISPLGTLDPSMWSADDRTPKMRDFRVAGTFYFGFDEYDRRLVAVSLAEAQAFFEGGDTVYGVEMRIDDIYRSRQVVAAIEGVLDGAPYRIIDWRELNHNLFTALQMQKVLLSLLLTVIVLVAAFGIVATLTMLVIDKTREIAVLKSLGMRSGGVARVFITAGMTIGALGTTAGIAIGVAVCKLVEHYGYRLDPRVYLIDRLPVQIHQGELAFTAAVTLAICLLATVYPAVRASALSPVEGLRYE